MPVSLSTALRVVGTSLFALAVLGGILAAYVTGYQFIHTEKHYLSFGLYGAILGLHLFIQSLFAFLEHRRMRGEGRPVRLGRSVALCIAAYQEDPDYLKKCLRSVKRIAFPDLKVVMVVDGNGPDDTYMLDIFHDVMGSERAGSYVWRSNFHAWGEGETEAGLREGLARVQALVRGTTYSCILQKWGGKREVMYTAFRALGDSVDYIQVAVGAGWGAVGTLRAVGWPWGPCGCSSAHEGLAPPPRCIPCRGQASPGGCHGAALRGAPDPHGLVGGWRGQVPPRCHHSGLVFGVGCPGAAVAGHRGALRSLPPPAGRRGPASSRRPWLGLARLGLGRLPGARGRQERGSTLPLPPGV